MDLSKTALLTVDLQNDFLHPEGAYGRAGQTAAEIAALPARLKPLVELLKAKGGWFVSTQFPLVPVRGEPMIAPHLKKIRPFLRAGDFAPGSWGNRLVDELGPADVTVEKIAYSAFYQTRMEWTLRKLGIEHLLVAGIVTNGGVATTFRAAHVREFDAILLEDGCAAFSQKTHDEAVQALRPVGRVASIAEMTAEIEAL